MTRCTVSGEMPANEDQSSVPNSATRADGQHVDHWVMCPTEIIKEGFKRPIRTSYQHVGTPRPASLRDLTPEETTRYAQFNYAKYEEYPPERSPVLGRFWTQAMIDAIGKGCGTVTSMPRQIAETYAANPSYYGSTFCCGCNKYLPVGAAGGFVWTGTNDRVGT